MLLPLQILIHNYSQVCPSYVDESSPESEIARYHTRMPTARVSGVGEGGGGGGGGGRGGSKAAPLLSGVFHTPVVLVIPFSCMSIACPLLSGVFHTPVVLVIPFSCMSIACPPTFRRLPHTCCAWHIILLHEYSLPPNFLVCSYPSEGSYCQCN